MVDELYANQRRRIGHPARKEQIRIARRQIAARCRGLADRCASHIPASCAYL